MTESKLAGFQWQIAENKTQIGLNIKQFCCHMLIRIPEADQISGWLTQWFSDIVRDPFSFLLICQAQRRLALSSADFPHGCKMATSHS